MKKFLFVISKIFSGKGVTRSFLDYRLIQEFLNGKILDLGSGSSDRYSKIIPKTKDSEYVLFDVKVGEEIDFEKDRLNYDDNTFDTVLLLNVLEHIYNYNHFLSEIKRIKKDSGVLIGFVPFLMKYHADPHDFFRYTHESLGKILKEVGYNDVVIENIYYGPYVSSFQMIYSTIPKILRPVFFVIVYGIDFVFRKFRKNSATHYVLGYYFKAK